MNIKDYFSAAIQLEQGDKIMIPCESKSVQESVRVRLFQLRNKYSYVDSNVAQSIGIYRADLEGTLFVVIEKRESAKGFIIKKDGNIVPFVASRKEGAGIERLVALALEDNVEADELINNLKGIYTPFEIIDEFIRQRPQEKSKFDSLLEGQQE